MKDEKDFLGTEPIGKLLMQSGTSYGGSTDHQYAV